MHFVDFPLQETIDSATFAEVIIEKRRRNSFIKKYKNERN